MRGDSELTNPTNPHTFASLEKASNEMFSVVTNLGIEGPSVIFEVSRSGSPRHAPENRVAAIQPHVNANLIPLMAPDRGSRPWRITENLDSFAHEIDV